MRTVIQLDPETHQLLSVEAASRDLTFGQIVTECLHSCLAESLEQLRARRQGEGKRPPPRRS